MTNSASARPKLPVIEQPIMVGFEIEDLNSMVDLALQGIHAAVVVRKSQINDFRNDVLGPILEERNLEITETRKFERNPMSAQSAFVGQRELIHLDAESNFSPRKKVAYPWTLTVSHTQAGKGILLAAGASSRVRAYTGDVYDSERIRLNQSKVVKSLLKKREASPGFNAVFGIEHRGVRGNLGAVFLGEGDVAIFPQGGEGSVSPSWHSIITQDQKRTSDSYHTKPNTSGKLDL